MADFISSVIQNGTDVPKVGFRGFVNNRLPQRMADAAELRSENWSSLWVVVLSGELWRRLPSDTTSADDGVFTIVDAGGNRWSKTTGSVPGLTWVGEWSGGAEYRPGDVVGHLGFIFISNAAGNVGNAPDVSGTPPEPHSDAFWTVMPLPEVPLDVVRSDDVRTITRLTQPEYDALVSPNSSTLYVIVEA